VSKVQKRTEENEAALSDDLIRGAVDWIYFLAVLAFGFASTLALDFPVT
jgi:hypothetical protein